MANALTWMQFRAVCIIRDTKLNRAQQQRSGSKNAGKIRIFNNNMQDYLYMSDYVTCRQYNINEIKDYISVLKDFK